MNIVGLMILQDTIDIYKQKIVDWYKTNLEPELLKCQTKDETKALIDTLRAGVGGETFTVPDWIIREIRDHGKKLESKYNRSRFPIGGWVVISSKKRNVDYGLCGQIVGYSFDGAYVDLFDGLKSKFFYFFELEQSDETRHKKQTG